MSARACRRLGVALVAAALSMAAATTNALAALPRTYQAQAVPSPQPTAAARFGVALVNAGDQNADGKDDILVGTDEHGGAFAGTVYVISGADGSAIKTLPPPDSGGTGNGAAWGGFVGKIGTNESSPANYTDIGSCAGFTGQPSDTCDAAHGNGSNTVGPPDGIPDLLVTALGVDVPFDTTGVPCPNPAASNHAPGTLVDAGRAYVVDGATGAVLKRIDMPPCDLVEQAIITSTPQKPAFGRTILAPAGMPPCVGNAGIGLCPAMPTAVRTGDMSGGGKPDIVVDASDYYETGATAHPQSDCHTANAIDPANQCLQSGRSFWYYGESIAGSSTTSSENTPDVEVKNPAAQADELAATTNHNRENLGYSIAPIGDVGTCNNTQANLNPGDACVNSATGKPDSTTSPDGRPDVVISSHRTDDFDMWDAGVALLIDGFTATVLATYRHPEPQPAALFGFSNYNQPAIGDVGSGTNPDSYQAAMRQNNPYTGGGRGYVMNGNFLQTGSPNGISFSTLSDPTPHPSEDFGTSSAGVGNVAGAETSPELDTHTEVLIGAYGPHNPGTDPATINDVHIFSPINEQELQRLDSSDQQPGSGFGNALAPLGDVNGDGFLDFAIGAGLYDDTTAGGAPIGDAGRIYLFTSDNSPAPPSPSPNAPSAGPEGPSGPPGVPGAAGPQGTAAVALTGRAVELDASAARVRRGRSVRLAGRLDAFAGGAACEAGQTVLVQRRTPGTARYRTLSTVRTDAGGGFRMRTRPTRTAFYRAFVPQTAACLGAVSGRERVAVTPASRARRAHR